MSKHLSLFVPMTLALAISQTLHAEPVLTLKSEGMKKEIAQKQRYNQAVYQIERNQNGERLLDMNNPVHYKLAKSRLALANMTIEDYPQLHQSLDDLKQQQSRSALKAEQGVMTAVPAGSDIVENSHMFLNMQVAVSPLDNEAYLLVRAESSVYGGTTSTFVDLLLEDVNGAQIAPSGATFTVLEGKQTFAVSSVKLSTLKQSNPTLDTIYASSWVETEAADGTMTSGLRMTEYPWDWAEMDALYSGNMGAAAKVANTNTNTSAQLVPTTGRPIYAATAPVDVNTDGVIKVCLNRAHDDCDYSADQYREPNEITDVNIPFQGQITVPHEITQIYSSDPTQSQPNGIDEMTNIYLQEGVYGGTTKQSYQGIQGGNGKSFSDYLTYEVDTLGKQTIISWDIPRAEGRFGNAMLFSNIAEADWRLNFAVKGKAYFRGRREANFQIQVNSNNIDELNNFYSPGLPKIKLGYSCLAKGTLITMADGSLKPIDQILKGEMVLGAMAENAATAQPMKVADVSIGIEALKMLRVIDATGKDILMTETHPVSTSNRGIVWAKELKKGDRILTADGSVLITKISKEKYNDNVYNLKLEPTANSMIADGSYLGMFANGLLVGDLDTQDEHNYKDQFIRETPEEKLLRLPAKWKNDYISSLNNK